MSELIGRTQFDFTYDEAVQDADPSKFAVYASDGTRFPADGIARPSANVVRISLPDIQEFGGTMVVAAAEEGAVKAEDGSDTLSTVGAHQLDSDQSPTAGATSGPDLISVSMDQSTGQVRYVFDEAVDDDETYDPSQFMVITSNGDMVRGRSFVETSGDSVLVTFDKNIVQAARGVSIRSGGGAGLPG